MKQNAGRILSLALCLALAVTVASAETKPAPATAGPRAVKPVMEDQAIAVLQAMSARLAAAKTMKFTAVATYESPSRYGAPLAYMTTSEVTLQRPDKLKVVTSADGPAVEFHYDGNNMTAYAPTEKLIASAGAPPTIDAMLEAVYDTAGTYFPYTDLIVANPYADMAKGMKLAFYIGQSNVVDGTLTDMVAYETDGVFVQLWVGTEDKLPRMARAVYFDDALRLRHQVELSGWKVDTGVKASNFEHEFASDATAVAFVHPKLRQPPAATAPKGPAPAVAPAPKAP